MMNVSHLPELGTDNKMIPVTNYGIKCMSMGLLVGQDLLYGSTTLWYLLHGITKSVAHYNVSTLFVFYDVMKK
jgi:ATP-binding protein involved in chromosome partitioning